MSTIETAIFATFFETYLSTIKTTIETTIFATFFETN
jgi:hypothetical protein